MNEIGAIKGVVESRSPLKSPSKGETKRVLLAWDDAAARLILHQKLLIAGFEVDDAANGTSAIQKLRTDPPDAVFLHLGLHGREGVDFIREARRHVEFGDRPIYVCTASASLNALVRRPANAGPTKFFNLLATPADSILSTAKAEVLGVRGGRRRRPRTEDREMADHIRRRIGESVGEIAAAVDRIRECTDSHQRANELTDLRTKFGSLVNCAAVAGFSTMARHVAACEAFIESMAAAVESTTESSYRSLVLAIEIIDRLSYGSAVEPNAGPLSAVVLANEDTLRDSISNVLVKGGFKPASFAGGMEALTHLEKAAVDVVVIDIDSPHEDGAEIGKLIRELPLHVHTPLVFVGEASAHVKVEPMLAPGRAEFAVKPLIFMEIAVRALGAINQNRTSASSASADSGTGLRNGVASRDIPAENPERRIFGTLQMDANGKILVAYHSCIEMFAWQRNELVEKNLSMLLAEESAEKLRAFVRAAKSSETKGNGGLEVTARRKDGSEFAASLMLSRSVEQPAGSWIAVFGDRTLRAQDGVSSEAAEENEPGTVLNGSKAPDQTAEELTQTSDTEPQVEFPAASAGSGGSGASSVNGFAVNGTDSSESAARCKQLQVEIAGMAGLCSDLMEKYAVEQDASAASVRRATQLEQQLTEALAELESTRADIVAKQGETNGAGLEAERQQWAKERETLQNELHRFQEKEASAETELADLRRRVNDASSSRVGISAELEQERADRRRIEQRAASLASQLRELHTLTGQHLDSAQLSQERVTALEKEVREREEALARSTAELENEKSQRHSGEEQLRAADDLIAQMRNCAASFDGAKETLQRRHTELEAQLETAQAATRELEARVQEQMRERERTEQALAAAKRGLDEVSQRSALEISKLRCEMEMAQADKKRLEGSPAQMRYASADSVRSGLATINRMRADARQPLNDMIQATRQLLDLELATEAKSVIDAVLKSALLVQASLAQPLAANASAAGDAGKL